MPIWTNHENLPQPLASAIMKDTYDRVGDISATGMIGAPRQKQLWARYGHLVVIDVAEEAYVLLGKGVHAALEWGDNDNHLAEERLIVPFEGTQISVKPDLLDPNGVVTDWKVTGVMAYLLGEKLDWTRQVNIQAWAYRKKGFKITGAQITAIFRDWKKMEAKRRADYPNRPMKNIPIELWPDEEVESYMRSRILLHKAHEAVPDRKLPLCTPEERWARPDTWAVKKKEAKRATRVYEDKETAELHLRSIVKEKRKEYKTEFRPGINVKCVDYCRVAEFCDFGKQLKQREQEA